MKERIKAILNNERGDFGIKQIAITVAVIVLIGVGITAMRGNLPAWITQIWNLFIDQIESLIS